MPETPVRSPRYTRFLLTGGLLGVLATAVVVAVRADVMDRPVLTFFYLGILFAGLGALLGGLVAVILEARRRRPS